MAVNLTGTALDVVIEGATKTTLKIERVFKGWLEALIHKEEKFLKADAVSTAAMEILSQLTPANLGTGVDSRCLHLMPTELYKKLIPKLDDYKKHIEGLKKKSAKPGSKPVDPKLDALPQAFMMAYIDYIINPDWLNHNTISVIVNSFLIKPCPSVLLIGSTRSKDQLGCFAFACFVRPKADDRCTLTFYNGNGAGKNDKVSEMYKSIYELPRGNIVSIMDTGAAYGTLMSDLQDKTSGLDWKDLLSGELYENRVPLEFYKIAHYGASKIRERTNYEKVSSCPNHKDGTHANYTCSLSAVLRMALFVDAVISCQTGKDTEVKFSSEEAGAAFSQLEKN